MYHGLKHPDMDNAKTARRQDVNRLRCVVVVFCCIFGCRPPCDVVVVVVVVFAAAAAAAVADVVAVVVVGIRAFENLCWQRHTVFSRMMAECTSLEGLCTPLRLKSAISGPRLASTQKRARVNRVGQTSGSIK